MAKVQRIRWLSFLQGTTLSLLKLSVLFALLWLIFRNVLTTGELIAMQFISVGDLGAAAGAGHHHPGLARGRAPRWRTSRELMAKPIDRRPQDADRTSGRSSRCASTHVVFRHRGATENALDDVSFAARCGDTIAFVGPSGSGKSTLVKLLLGPVPRRPRARSSTTTICTRDLRYNEARRQVGFVTQETSLFAGTVRENMLFVKPDATDARDPRRAGAGVRARRCWRGCRRAWTPSSARAA